MLDALFGHKLDKRGLLDIQGLILRIYRLNYGKFVFLRFDNADHARHWIADFTPRVTNVLDWDRHGPETDFTWNVAFTYPGFQAMGLPDATLGSFAAEFRQGMAARAAFLGDTGSSAPEHWEAGLGIEHDQIHAVVILYAKDEAICQREYDWFYSTQVDLYGVTIIYQQDVAILPTGREHFGYRDAIGAPAVENSGAAPWPGQDVVRTGEFILGYHDEANRMPPMPEPAILGRHGSYMVMRKLRQDVAAFRAFLAAQAAALGIDEELLAAKLMGRWRSGAPLALAPDHDDPALGADPERNNDFKYRDDDPKGYVVPLSSHIRRGMARDAQPEAIADVQRHRVLRGGIPYGPPLPEGAPDDGVDRGLIFVFFGASIERQFEFVQTVWMNDGDFMEQGTDRDPITGANDGTTNVVIPWRPVRKRLKGVPRFVTTRGGGYFFMPSLTALRWLANPTAERALIEERALELEMAAPAAPTGEPAPPAPRPAEPVS
jgi:Dyp-type peroxidase family